MSYDIALRQDDLGLDDVVVKNVSMFRMERMDDDYIWLACYLEDGQEIVFDLWRDKKVIKYEAREPLPDVRYEGQVPDRILGVDLTGAHNTDSKPS